MPAVTSFQSKHCRQILAFLRQSCGPNSLSCLRMSAETKKEQTVNKHPKSRIKSGAQNGFRCSFFPHFSSGFLFQVENVNANESLFIVNPVNQISTSIFFSRISDVRGSSVPGSSPEVKPGRFPQAQDQRSTNWRMKGKMICKQRKAKIFSRSWLLENMLLCEVPLGRSTMW